MATQRVHASYQEVIDLHTEDKTVTCLAIHCPTSDAPHRMMPGFFEQFRQFHYDGCSLALVPAARLPADISQVSYENGEPPIDPRDLLNPILYKGCHGEDLSNILNTYLNGPGASGSAENLDYSDSIEKHDAMRSSGNLGGQYGKLFESLYYRAMTDSTWGKAHPQRGFRKSGLHPMVYDLATNTPFMNGSNLFTNVGPMVADNHASTQISDDLYSTIVPGYDGSMGQTTNSNNIISAKPFGPVTATYSGSDVTLQTPRVNSVNFFTPRLRGLGWIDTRNRLVTSSTNPYTMDADSVPNAYWNGLNNLFSSDIDDATRGYNKLPLLYMCLILLPPSYRVEQYFRLILTHRFSFRGFRGASLSNDDYSTQYKVSYYNMNDDRAGAKTIDEDKEVDPLGEYFEPETD